MVHVKDSKFYGPSDSLDCDKQNFCLKEGLNTEYCKDSTALLISYFSNSGKGPLVKTKSSLPYHGIKSDASWGGSSFYENLQFIDFKSERGYCGENQKLFRLNPSGADYHPRAKFFNTKFEVSL